MDPATAWQRVALLDDRVVGFIHGNFDPENDHEEFRACIWRINVDADAQGKGVGRFLAARSPRRPAPRRRPHHRHVGARRRGPRGVLPPHRLHRRRRDRVRRRHRRPRALTPGTPKRRQARADAAARRRVRRGRARRRRRHPARAGRDVRRRRRAPRFPRRARRRQVHGALRVGCRRGGGSSAPAGIRPRGTPSARSAHYDAEGTPLRPTATTTATASTSRRPLAALTRSAASTGRRLAVARRARPRSARRAGCAR